MTQREKDARRAAEPFRQQREQEELELTPPEVKKEGGGISLIQSKSKKSGDSIS